MNLTPNSYGGKIPGTHGEWTSMDTTVLMESSNTATTATNTHGTHLSGDTTQDGPCTGLDHAVVLMTLNRLNLSSNGGKTPGIHGEWTSMDTTTKTDNSHTAITTTHTVGIQQLGDTIQDG